MKPLFLFGTRRAGPPRACDLTWKPVARVKLLLRMMVVAGTILATGRLVMWAAECANSGNTYWTKTLADPCFGVATHATNVYWIAGTVLSRMPLVGGSTTERNFVTVTLGQPVVMDRAAGDTVVVVAGSDGFVHSLHEITLATQWSRSLRRSTCSADTIEAAPVVQLRQLSDTNFQAEVNKDLVIVGTSHRCSSTTTDRIYALDAATGTIIWAHNNTATYQYGNVTGLVLDYERNTVYATMRRQLDRVQNTVVAINTLTGARRWAADYGPVEAAPVLVNGGLFVAGYRGTLYKLNPDTGAIIWQTNVTPQLIARNFVVDPAFNTIYVTATSGTLHALLDTCTGPTVLWSNWLSGALVITAPALLTVPSARKLYAGSANGRVYQLNPATGTIEGYATIDSGVSVNLVEVTRPPGVDNGSGYRLIAAGGDSLKRICIPWNIPADNALVGDDSKSLIPVPNCSDSNAPASGLVITGDLDTMTSQPGQGSTRFLTLGKSNCYPFQCASLLGNTSSNLGVSVLTSTNGSTAWDTNSFLASATVGLPMNFSLTVTSSIPGTYLTTVTLANAGTVHATLTVTNIVLPSEFTPPVAHDDTYTRNAGTSFVIAFANLLANDTDADGDALTFTGVSLTTTNGKTLTTNSTSILYTNNLNVDDRFTYTISDGRGGSATGMVVMLVNVTNMFGRATSVTPPNGNEPVTVRCAGIPGLTYEVQRSTNLVDWVARLTTNAPPTGTFRFTDDFSDIGGAPASAYFRLRYVP